MKRSNISRKKNPALRNKHRRKNYLKSRPKGKRRSRPWLPEEEQAVVVLPQYGFEDRDIAGFLKRSVQAVQTRRYELKKERSCV